ncbi:mitochondrial carrier [Piromyces finnis]|uniref:Mitochondrial carrier n=1 Tax=Piromyces finnis TaxID=1754191 RepID=A0A1Y1VN85_9FUNG|nr:mitochondrial carrier [Piromyces finnis]|eukprot:ORX60869.1 mitochondrial carrier [Piromyces finnis]
MNLTDEQEKQLKLNEVDDLVFGAISGIAGKIVEFPFDTVKVRLQTSSKGTFNGTFDCIVKTYKNEGIFGFYKGLSSPLVGSMIENGILFSGFSYAQHLIKKITKKSEDEPLSMAQYTLAGGIAGTGAAMLLTPVELVKCKLQVQDVEALYQQAKSSATSNIATNTTHNVSKIYYKGPIHVIYNTIKNHGIRGMYRGHLGTLIREVGGGAAWFGVYELACNYMMKSSHIKNKDDLPPWKLAISGALAGVAYNSTSFPVDMIKSRMQTEKFIISSTGKKIGQKLGKGFIATATDIYKSGGIRAFYKGCGITIARSVPSSGIIFVTYELLKRNFGRHEYV